LRFYYKDEDLSSLANVGKPRFGVHLKLYRFLQKVSWEKVRYKKAKKLEKEKEFLGKGFPKYPTIPSRTRIPSSRPKT
jgi:hypothetical protein